MNRKEQSTSLQAYPGLCSFVASISTTRDTTVENDIPSSRLNAVWVAVTLLAKHSTEVSVYVEV